MQSALAGPDRREETHLLVRVVTEDAGELRRHRRAPGLGRRASTCTCARPRSSPRRRAVQDLVDRGRRSAPSSPPASAAGGRRHRPGARASTGRPPADGQIGDMRLADERHHVVLAMRIEGDVPHQHDVVIALDLLESPVEHLGRVLVVAGKISSIGLRRPAPGFPAGPRGRDRRRSSDQVRTAASACARRRFAHGSDDRPTVPHRLGGHKRSRRGLHNASITGLSVRRTLNPAPAPASRWNFTAKSAAPPSRAGVNAAFPTPYIVGCRADTP